ncbi:hypothetical protein JEQ07_24775 [Serratia proteamaculans]|uniref:FixH family protein n=1 Tax=Serratia proteamaculans TaxID=28151 RepID=A0ABS0U1M5_SERPR|nr:hypothetical protein [Serratia proteamaculans]MBI6183598.1 hypothetical protein [Serratia proteamaculans]
MEIERDDEIKSRNVPVVEHLPLLRVSWCLEKLGYIFIFTVVFLALLGFFSNGILSDKEKLNESETLKINYEKFVRNGTQTELKIRIKDDGNKNITVTISDQLDTFYMIESVVPQSLQVRHQGNNLYFTSQINASQQWHTFTFILRSKEWGEFETRITGEDGKPVTINQWIYP